MGGGQHGHLGLLISPVRYAALVHTEPWVTPVNPGPFVPPAGGTGSQIEAAKDVWRELKQSFELCQATEKALVAQIVESIDPICIRALLNRATGQQYSTSIRAVGLHLFTTYGKITPQQVKGKEMDLYNMHYDISQPVDTVFNTILFFLAKLAEHAVSPMSAQQMIDLAYVIFAKQPILQHDLRLWNRRPLAERTWPLMLEHFRDAQADLSSLPTAGDIYHLQPGHQANTVQSMADLVAQRLLDDMPPVVDSSADTPDLANSLQRRESDLQSREAAMLTQMQDLTLMRASATTPSTRPNCQSTSCGRGSRNTDRGRGRNNSSRGSNTRLYCWSHGACAQTGAECNSYPLHRPPNFCHLRLYAGRQHYWLLLDPCLTSRDSSTLA